MQGGGVGPSCNKLSGPCSYIQWSQPVRTSQFGSHGPCSAVQPLE